MRWNTESAKGVGKGFGDEKFEQQRWELEKKKEADGQNDQIPSLTSLRALLVTIK